MTSHVASRSKIPPAKDCTLYFAGHSVHPIQALRGANRPDDSAGRRVGQIVQINGQLIDIALGRDVEQYRNHDPDRLKVLVQRFGTDVIVDGGHSLMRVAGRWCLSVQPDTGEPLSACRTDPMTEVTTQACAVRLRSHGGFLADPAALTIGRSGGRLLRSPRRAALLSRRGSLWPVSYAL